MMNDLFMRILTWIAILLSGFAMGWTAHALLVPAGPDCPTEDSCTIDYHDGRWIIEEGTP